MKPIYRDYVAFIYRYGLLEDIYAARDLACLTSMVLARGLSSVEYVRYSREVY